MVQAEALFDESLQRPAIPPEVLRVITAGLAEEFAARVFQSASLPTSAVGVAAPAFSAPTALASRSPSAVGGAGATASPHAAVLDLTSSPAVAVPSPVVIEPIVFTGKEDYRPTPAGKTPTYYHDLVRVFLVVG